MPSIITPRSQKRFVRHTRFSLSLRTVSSPKRYHKLLLFRLSPMANLETSQKHSTTRETISNTTDGATQMDEEEVLFNGVELYCMEATCPHLSAPLSHAEFAEPEVEEPTESNADSSECETKAEETENGQGRWDLEPEMRDMEDVVGQPGRTIVCPWHLYDFDLRDGSSSTGMSVCVYSVEVRKRKKDTKLDAKNEGVHWDVYIEEPEVEGEHEGETDADQQKGNKWEVVEVRGVSEDFADPPIASSTSPGPNETANPSGLLSSITTTLQETLTLKGDSQSTTPINPISELPTKSLLSSALLILETSSATEKIRRTRQTLEALRTGKFKSLKPSRKDVEAARNLFRPLEPEEERERISRRENVKQGRTAGGFVPPRDDVKTVDVWNVKNRGKGGNEKSRILMLHALANIEQWAIDLAWDIMARFADFEINGERLPAEFFLDWAKRKNLTQHPQVAEDEAKHFSLLNKRLEELGSYFGAHSVHAGLWDSALETSHSLLSRLAIIHLVAEARGLDVNPLTIEKFRRNKDFESVKVLEVIHSDEITHVTTGHRWFTWICERMGLDPVEQFREEVRANFRGKLKGPFNTADRLTAGMTSEYYTDLEGLATSRWHASDDKPGAVGAVTEQSAEQFRQKNAQGSAEGDLRIHPRLT
ncbi:hypothetical protein QFC19_001194 [Naganishia cerealis]|uniref:Uncharacterized protein n=1 Tax=Naganishia cerealis TaxID=610337 RepID=A0ACC2WJB5_9TREE|nr:hypothetical protein QFC19_001194 [Naganishia cerealis]